MVSFAWYITIIWWRLFLYCPEVVFSLPMPHSVDLTLPFPARESWSPTHANLTRCLQELSVAADDQLCTPPPHSFTTTWHVAIPQLPLFAAQHCQVAFTYQHSLTYPLSNLLRVLHLPTVTFLPIFPSLIFSRCSSPWHILLCHRNQSSTQCTTASHLQHHFLHLMSFNIVNVVVNLSH